MSNISSRSNNVGGALVLGFCMLLAVAPLGCRLVQGVADVSGKAVRTVTPGNRDNRKAIDPVALQQDLMRFADDFSARMIDASDRLEPKENVDHAAIQSWKIGTLMNTWSTAAGPNAVASLLDLVAMVTVLRLNVEEYWIPDVFGDSAQLLLDAARAAESDIWKIAGGVLDPTQAEELRSAIAEWRTANPDPGSMAYARQVGFSHKFATKSATDDKGATSIFGALMIDPLAGLDPVAREVAQTRLLGERSLYVAQRMPLLLQWQVELISMNLTELPEVRQVVENSTGLTESIDRFADVAESMPELVQSEREAILAALEDQERALTPLVREVREALVAGGLLSDSLNTTLTTVSAMIETKDEEGGPSMQEDVEKEPFQVEDYTAAAAQLEASALQLTELLRTVDDTLGSTNLLQLTEKVGPAVDEARAGGEAVINHAFIRLAQLVAIILVACLVYRVVARKLKA